MTIPDQIKKASLPTTIKVEIPACPPYLNKTRLRRLGAYICWLMGHAKRHEWRTVNENVQHNGPNGKQIPARHTHSCEYCWRCGTKRRDHGNATEFLNGGLLIEGPATNLVLYDRSDA